MGSEMCIRDRHCTGGSRAKTARSLKDLQSTLDGKKTVRFSFMIPTVSQFPPGMPRNKSLLIVRGCSLMLMCRRTSSNRVPITRARGRRASLRQRGRGAQPRSNRKRAGRGRTIGDTMLARQYQNNVFVVCSRAHTGFSIRSFRSVGGRTC